jgi:hypothetical protein
MTGFSGTHLTSSPGILLFNEGCGIGTRLAYQITPLFKHAGWEHARICEEALVLTTLTFTGHFRGSCTAADEEENGGEIKSVCVRESLLIR